ncbi:hypothetical protein M885DRAFT_546484 [Pelagophyceae sp. CCMP2097]|nr:hypothetical protein M885DRAFT_546484 [Pelagophyceae sp. CCMP2097]
MAVGRSRTSVAALAAAGIVLQHEGEPDVVGLRVLLVVVERVVEDGEDALGRRRVGRVRRDAAEAEADRRELRARRLPPRRNVERVLAVRVEALLDGRDRRDERAVPEELELHRLADADERLGLGAEPEPGDDGVDAGLRRRNRRQRVEERGGVHALQLPAVAAKDARLQVVRRRAHDVHGVLDERDGVVDLPLRPWVRRLRRLLRLGRRGRLLRLLYLGGLQRHGLGVVGLGLGVGGLCLRAGGLGLGVGGLGLGVGGRRLGLAAPARRGRRDRGAFGGVASRRARRAFGGRAGGRRAFGGRDGRRRAFGGRRRAFGGRDGRRRVFGGCDSGRSHRRRGGRRWPLHRLVDEERRRGGGDGVEDVAEAVVDGARQNVFQRHDFVVHRDELEAVALDLRREAVDRASAQHGRGDLDVQQRVLAVVLQEPHHRRRRRAADVARDERARPRQQRFRLERRQERALRRDFASPSSLHFSSLLAAALSATSPTGGFSLLKPTCKALPTSSSPPSSGL